MRTRHGGTTLLSYEVHNGHAIYQGDIDLGPVAKLHQRGGAAVLGDRWDSNTIFYRLSPNLTGTVCDPDCKAPRARIREVLDELSTQLPIELVEDVGETHDDFILYRYDASIDSGGVSDAVGMDGGEQHIGFAPGADSNGIRGQPNGGTIRHETLHALGFHHEQSRTDRDQFVEIHGPGNGNCIMPDKLGNYALQDDSDDIGPYDFSSIMHYRNGSFCIKNADNSCKCDTITPKINGATISPGGDLTAEDVNTLYQMYAHSLAISEINDAFGTALAVGDFDDDGYDDLAVGIPFENVDGHVNAGAVTVFKGTSNGPVAWQLLTERSLDGHLTDGAHFGRALAALDVNGDGITDLAVGAPEANGGYVMIFQGTRERRLIASRKITQESLGFTTGSADRFGFALAAGPITGTTRDGHKFDALVIGAPGDFYQNTRTGVAYITNDYVTAGGSIDPVKATRLVPGGDTWAAGDNFGAALAVGDLDGDGKADVVVGAPNHAADDGGIYVFAGRKPPETSPASWSAMATPTKQIRGPTHSQFGTALAIGNVLSGGGIELVVGAPAGFGQVNVLQGGVTPSTVKVLREGNPEAGDGFGTALAIGGFDESSSVSQLIVGAPGENAGAGAIVTFRGADLGTRLALFQSDASNGTVVEAGDKFGASLAVGQLDGRGRRLSTAHNGALKLDLVIGAPGERFDDDTPGVGAVTLMRGTGAWSPESWKTIGQGFSGRLDD